MTGVYSAQRTGQGHGVDGELDQRHVHVQLVADTDVRDTLVHVPVHGQRQRRRVDQIPQTENVRRHVHHRSAATGHRLQSPHGRAHRRRRHFVGAHVRHSHQVRR